LEIDNYLIKGYQEFELGNLDEAEKLLNSVLKKEAKNFYALLILGVISGKKGNHLMAKKYLMKAVCINPNDSHAQFNLAKSLDELGYAKEALPYHSNAVKLNPNFEEAWINYGKCLRFLCRNSEAKNCFNEAINLNPKSVVSIINKAEILRGEHEYYEAINLLKSKLGVSKDLDHILHNNSGSILHTLKKYKEALSEYENAIYLNPEYAEAWSNMGALLCEMSEYEQAQISIKKSIEINEESPQAWSNMGSLLIELDQLKDAIKNFEKSIKISPNRAETWTNKGHAYQLLGEKKQAISDFKKAIEIEPEYAEAHNNLAHIYLDNFNFLLGWSEYKWRFKTRRNETNPPKHNKPQWKGLASKARLYIWGEQGIGDQILFCTMLSSIKEYKYKIIVAVDKKLVNILVNSFPKIRVVDKNTNINEEEYDEQISLGGLGEYLRSEVNDFPETAAYINEYLYIGMYDIKKLEKNKKTIGISWKSTNKLLGKCKSIDLQLLYPILKLKEFNIINLQYGNVEEELINAEKKIDKEIINIKEIDLYNNLEDLAMLVARCDIVISISNTVAHLSGAMGKEVLLLTPYSKGKFWYWSASNNRSLWYPTIKIIQQKEQNNWDDVIENIIKYLGGVI